MILCKRQKCRNIHLNINISISVVAFFCMIIHHGDGNMVSSSSTTASTASTANTASTTNSSPETGEQWTYLYNANTTVTSNLSSDAASQWSLSAKLIIQSFKSYKIMKLDDVKTTLFNGPTINVNLEEKILPKIPSKILTEPFITYYNQNYDKLLSISFSQDDEEWSKNIKKSIASSYQLDLNSKEESNIHGKCKIFYEHILEGNATKIIKKINNHDCIIENSLKHSWDDIPLGYFTGTISRQYNFNKKLINIENTPVNNINSQSTFLYSMLKSDRTILQIKQSQCLSLLETKSNFQSIDDTTKYTINTTPIYEFSNNTRNDRFKDDPKKILSNWMDHYFLIKNQINQNSSSNIDENRFNVINKLRNYFTLMDDDLLRYFRKDEFTGEAHMLNIFSSMLPYIGTEASLNFIRNKIQDEVFTLAHVRLLALFPLYVKNVDEDILSSMESLLKMNNVTQPTIKQNYILSFSNLVHQAFYSKLSSSNNYTETEVYYKNLSKKYVVDYYQLFLVSQDYSQKMKYLLGMMNMGDEALPYLYKIVQNSTETRHIRSLAIYCIKPNLLHKNRHQIYQFFWPIVKNASEPFEIRAAALSILLGSNINSSELYSILSYMNQTSFDPAKQHLHNYFYTSAVSGKTDCNCTIKHLAKEMILNLNRPETNQGLLTSYHQVSYTDDEKNFQTSLNLHVVANPVTNFVNVLKLTLNHYTGSDKTGEFAIYVKAEGINSKLYKEEYERHYAIKELYKILSEMQLAFNNDYSENLHIELILFYEKNAIFSLFINIDNVDEMSDFIDELIVYLGNNDIVTIRDVRKMHFTSDLGTPLYVSLNYEHILGTEFGNYDKIFLNVNTKDDDDENYVLTRIRSMWCSKLNFVSHNPLTNTNHGVSKIYSLQNFVKFKIDYNVYDLSIKWNDNSSYFDTLIDYKYAVFIDSDHDYLGNNCGGCQPVVFISEKTKTEKNLTLWLWAKNIIIKEVNCTNPRFPNNPLHSIIKKSRVSYTGLPFMQPFVLVAYISDYFYYIPQHEICSVSVNTERIVKQPNLSTLKITFINDALDENYKLNLNFNITLALTQTEMPSRKKLHQWNLNLQRQELKTGVSYELHYDDNGRSVKFDVKSDLDYLPTSQSSDMFSLKPAEPILSRTLFHLKEINSEPTEVQIKSIFSISDDQIKQVNASKSFELCQKDHESEIFNEVLVRHTPPTISCHNASIGLSTYDNYQINIQFKNVSSKMRKYLRDEILQPIKDKEYEGQDIITNKSFNVSVIYSALYSTLNMKVGQDHVVSNYSVPELVRPWALLKPTSRLIDELRYNMFGLDNVCIIIPRYVISFTGKIIEHDTDTTIIPLIECTNTTQLGLTTNRFTYKLWSDENTFQLGKKEGGYYVMRNKKILKHNVRAEDYTVEFINDHTFHITTSRIDLYYNGEYLTVKIKSAFINRMCGMCTTNEYVAPNTVNKYFN